MEEAKNYWRKCSTCKKEIGYGAAYQVCSVSTCRKSVYCSVTCWDIHVPVMNHKSAWAEEEIAPPKIPVHQEESRAPRRIMVNTSGQKGSVVQRSDIPIDILIVASKLKHYIKVKYDLNTSANVMEKLSDIVRKVTDDAAEHARLEGRKTIMDKDF
ncbi:MAG: hypothetical protein ISR65_11895 [Bacteriovoracaceae bacterium]|nr:hypothetical protein [Bacteriovoracaceae bacterium]